MASAIHLIRAITGLTMACFSALLMTLAFPPFGLWPLIFVGLVPALAIVDPWGRVIESSVSQRAQKATVMAEVSLGTGRAG